MHNDNVNHPNHYTSGPFECIELTSRYPFLGGNAIKYVYRWQGKNGLEDLRKALWYLNRAKEESPYEPLGLYPLDSFVPPYCYFHMDDESVHMLRKLARLNWQNMRGFWKGTAELACDHKSGYTRAKKTLERRIRLLESMLTDEEQTVLSAIWQDKELTESQNRIAYRLQARGLAKLDKSDGVWNPTGKER